MRYATLEAASACGRCSPLRPAKCPARPERLEIAAAAVECIHAYSLVHDDLPCMDDDTLRRGKPTVHVEYDEATALLVGDALQSLAFQLLAEHRLADDPRIQLDMVKTLALAAGSRGMAGGQQIDLEATGKALDLPELEFMHIHKTGALIRAAVLLGAACGRTLERKAEARQVRQGDRSRIPGGGRRARLRREHGDARQDGRQGFEARQADLCIGHGHRARARLAEELRAEAHAALAGIGAPARRLGELADFIVLRKF